MRRSNTHSCSPFCFSYECILDLTLYVRTLYLHTPRSIPFDHGQINSTLRVCVYISDILRLEKLFVVRVCLLLSSPLCVTVRKLCKVITFTWIWTLLLLLLLTVNLLIQSSFFFVLTFLPRDYDCDKLISF